MSDKRQMTVAEWEEWATTVKMKGDGFSHSMSEWREYYETIDSKRPVVARRDTETRVSYDVLDEQCGHWYYNPASDFSTPDGIVDCICHLLTKEWVTREHLRQLFKLLQTNRRK